MTKIKIGILGAGKISDIHLETLGKNKHVSLVSISDSNLELATKKAKQYGIEKIESDYSKILNDPEIDVVDILLPHHLHYRASMDAIHRGKVVICEKPFVIKLSDAKSLMKINKTKNISIHLKHYLRYSASHSKLKKLLHEGIIGTPYLVQCFYTCNSVAGMNDKRSWKGNIKEAGGGVLMDAGVHVVDFLQDIFGNPRSVSSECKQIFTKLKIKGEDLAMINLEFPNNVMAEITCTSNDTSYGFRWEKHIFGSEGSLHIIDYGKNKNELLLYKNGEVVMREDEDDWWNQANKNILNDIIGKIINKEKPTVDLNTAYIGLKTIIKAYESAKAGKRLKI